jgi:FAD/FMN-containing dehydrogenase
VNAYALRKARLLADLAAGNVGVGLAKDTSNLFRDRAPRPRPRIDLSPFDTVLKVDPAAGTVEAEGMVKFVDLVDATLPHGTMPAVVPQLKSITLGGAVAGVGIEASSFRHGLVHENIVAMDVLTGDGRIVTCTPDNEHAALFHGMPNSYGTLGYALKLTMRTMPVQSFVTLAHRRFGSAETFLRAMTADLADRSIAFLDGVAFAPDELVLTEGRLVDAAPYASDYTFERIYYRSLRERTVDFLTVRDFLWRWDTDWFWCSRNVGAQHPWLRRLLGRRRLNSVTYQRIMRWNSRTEIGRAHV